ncbi:hypothetical protein [Methylomicrobium agile]|nr:hypothetical protein [Methylomicrobium agile]
MAADRLTASALRGDRSRTEQPDQHVDGVIELTGINPANFSEAAIIL